MKKSKIIVPALGILVLSTAAAVTGTVAWFTSSSVLNVTGMYAKIDAENGIVVANEAKNNWATSAEASHSGENIAFILSSTADFEDWYHANSVNAETAAPSGTIEELVVNQPTAGTGDQNTGIATATLANGSTKNIYLINRFYIQSATQVALTGQDLFVKNIEVAGPATLGSANLDKALRVGFSFTYNGVTTNAIYGVYNGYTASYSIGGTVTVDPDTGVASRTGATAVTALDGSLTNGADIYKIGNNIDIPSFVQAGTGALEVEVFAYFEGEDAEAKSANITSSLDELAISFQFENAIHA